MCTIDIIWTIWTICKIHYMPNVCATVYALAAWAAAGSPYATVLHKPCTWLYVLEVGVNFAAAAAAAVAAVNKGASSSSSVS